MGFLTHCVINLAPPYRLFITGLLIVINIVILCSLFVNWQN
jgi:hypothetical protein